MQVVFIGAGRLASSLAPALTDAGHQVLQVFSRTLESAQALAAQVGAAAVTDLSAVVSGADAYIFSVTDTALPTLAAELSAALGDSSPQSVFLHTAGSIAMSIFASSALHYGVLYPMQTFSKERRVDMSCVPVFIEGCDECSLSVAEQLARSVSSQVLTLSSEGRRHLHLAAVFACNFANHCYQLSAEILSRYDIPFSVMLPLIDETAAKVHELPPVQAQTGPAVRFDQGVLAAQQQLLSSNPRLAQIYELMSQSIHESHQNHIPHD